MVDTAIEWLILPAHKLSDRQLGLMMLSQHDTPVRQRGGAAASCGDETSPMGREPDDDQRNT
jgi:hypothetical protein